MRLGKLAGARFQLLFQPDESVAPVANARSRLRSGRTKLAAARWVLCAFERQGHLVGTVTGPLPVGPSQGSSLSILTDRTMNSRRRSFDHLVGAGEQRRRNGDAERPGRLQVDDELEFGRLLDRQVLRLRSS